MINGYLNYTGNKFKLLEQLMSEFDYSKKYFVDLFTGSFVVGANVVDKYEKVLANDIIKELVGIHKALLEGDEIIENTKALCNNKDSQDAYNELRKSYNQNKTPEKLWALILSCNSNLIRFNKSGEFNQTWGKRGWNPNTDKKVEEFINHIRQYKDKIIFSNKHFNDIKISKPSMVYIDPPYGYCEDENGNILNNQISEAGYNVLYKKENDIQLYEYVLDLDKNGSSFMLSGLLEHDGNKSWLLNQLIRKGFRCKELQCDYDKISKKGKKESKEVIIMNYE